MQKIVDRRQQTAENRVVVVGWWGRGGVEGGGVCGEALFVGVLLLRL
jgi:hypothetical protein